MYEQDELDQFLAFTDDYLIIASPYQLKYVYVHDAFFRELKPGDRDKSQTQTLQSA